MYGDFNTNITLKLKNWFYFVNSLFLISPSLTLLISGVSLEQIFTAELSISKK